MEDSDSEVHLRYVTPSNITRARVIRSEDGSVLYRHELGTWGDDPDYDSCSFVFPGDDFILDSMETDQVRYQVVE